MRLLSWLLHGLIAPTTITGIVMRLNTAGAQIIFLASYLPPDAVGHGFGAVSVFRGRLHARTPAFKQEISEAFESNTAIDEFMRAALLRICYLYLKAHQSPLMSTNDRCDISVLQPWTGLHETSCVKMPPNLTTSHV